ncbi:nuclear transport factor 2 family protein [Pseudooceanicola sp. C21-150M6]|uniref:nuclear transport factor 2 family protein n=1 Tax=Pseudooceanicola sp. C21-150M6 TaxID=3434355 RepID=UPI003D7FA66D
MSDSVRHGTLARTDRKRIDAMYHAFVRARIRALFHAASTADSATILAGFAPRFEHIFLGDHALGGTRTSMAKTRDWYDRLYRLLPDIGFEITRIAVKGWPWATLAVIDWTERNSGTDGVVTTNAGCHIVEIAWGKITRLTIVTDTAVLQKTLDRLAAGGVAEAHAPPITG